MRLQLGLQKPFHSKNAPPDLKGDAFALNNY